MGQTELRLDGVLRSWLLARWCKTAVRRSGNAMSSRMALTRTRRITANTVVNLSSKSTRDRPRRFRADAYLARSELQLLDVTTLWPWVVDGKPFCGRTRRDDECDEENCITLAIVPRNMRVVATFNPTLACLVDALVTLMVIASHGTRLDRNQNYTGMMVPSRRATRPDGNLHYCNISLSLRAIYTHTIVLGM